MTDAEIADQVRHCRRLHDEAVAAQGRADEAEAAAEAADKAARAAVSDAKAAQKRWCEARDYLAGMVTQ